MYRVVRAPKYMSTEPGYFGACFTTIVLSKSCICVVDRARKNVGSNGQRKGRAAASKPPPPINAYEDELN